MLVVGTGGVGLNSVQGAALRGAAPIIAADLSPAKREAAGDALRNVIVLGGE